MPNAIVIAVDGLRVSALGGYGNTWHPTPAFDQLASQSLVFDWMWCTGARRDSFYAACWYGDLLSSPSEKEGGRDSFATGDSASSAISPVAKESRPLLRGAPASLPVLLANTGVAATLLTDDASIADLGASAAFAEVQRLKASIAATAADVDETQLALLFAAAVEQLQQWSESTTGDGSANSRLLWIHAKGFHGAWDAPISLRQDLLEDEDPPAAAFVEPPNKVQTSDHDELLVYRSAYAAQTIVLDECLAGLLAALDEFQLTDDTLVLLVGCRGFALGEHGAVGSEVDHLYSELLHVPYLVRRPGVAPPPPRSSRLVDPREVFSTLCDWFKASSLPPQSRHGLLAGDLSLPDATSPFVVAHGESGERAIRTPAWMLREAPDLPAEATDAASSGRTELYVKPDDRWEANEVADRCPDVVERLLALLDHLDQAGAHVEPRSVEPLDGDLITPAR